MVTNSFRRTQQQDSINKYAKYGFSQNPFPIDPTVKPFSEDRRENGSIFLEELRSEELEEFKQRIVNSRTKIGFLMDYAAYKGRGIGKTAFMNYVKNEINCDLGDKMSNGAQVLYAIYVSPSPEKRERTMSLIARNIYTSMLNSELLQVVFSRLRAFSEIIPESVLAKIDSPSNYLDTICNDDWLIQEGVDINKLNSNVSQALYDIGVPISFEEGQYLMDCLNQENTKVRLGNLPMEYVKSSPYLLSFMDKYELKKRIASALQHSDVKRYGKMDALLLSKYTINNYRPIPAANGKLKYLHDLVFGTRHEKKTQLLLRVPASNLYYKAGGVFESNEARNFSKIILFSSWEMVPRMISIMMSYYSELYTLGELKKVEAEIRYTSQKKNRYGENRLRADGLLEYPCQTLSGLFSPTTFYGEKLSSIRKIIKQRIQEEFAQNTIISSIPQQGRNNAKLILTLMKILDGKPVEDLNDLYVPSNALDVMTDIAIASPAVCAYRQSGNEEDAQMVAKAIVSVFNKPESAAVIDLMYNKKSDDDYYESVLDYCVVGNLQAVLDEYAHMTQTKMLGHTITEAIIGTSNLSIDTTDSLGMEEKKQLMRCHFAIPFIDKTVTDKSVARTTNIRKAFNSPFRPFLLSTTSIGQEGLDFHWYARKIVHWNLPSNPVDLEQREGRINRFKCLAIRRNVVKLYGSETYHTWDELFSLAYSNLKGTHSDIVPYWCLPVAELTEEQRAKLEYIERIVPLYPLSRDRYKYERLIKVLALYRMTLGQPRQEELLNLLKNMHLSDEQLKKLTIDLCPYNKKSD